MTNEEIERLYLEMPVSEIENYTGRTVDLQTHETLQGNILGFGQALVARAYEEAMKATCELCMTEWPVREQMFGEIKGYVHDAPSATHTGTEVVLCKATNVRALRDSLVRESVST